MRHTSSDTERRDRLRNLLADTLRDAIGTGVRDFEREVDAVHDAAKNWAVDHDGFVLTIDDVRRIDSTAVGHVDWFNKLTLRVADGVIYGNHLHAAADNPPLRAAT